MPIGENGWKRLEQELAQAHRAKGTEEAPPGWQARLMNRIEREARAARPERERDAALWRILQPAAIGAAALGCAVLALILVQGADPLSGVELQAFVDPGARIFLQLL